MIFIQKNLHCPQCEHQSFTPIRQFQLMFKTSIGVVEDAKSVAYLRPETAQGIFINYKNGFAYITQKNSFWNWSNWKSISK